MPLDSPDGKRLMLYGFYDLVSVGIGPGGSHQAGSQLIKSLMMVAVDLHGFAEELSKDGILL